MEPTVSFKGMEPSPAVTAKIADKAAKLERFADAGLNDARHRTSNALSQQ
jgi:hypothetical protein